jgi:acetolactate synthase-1/2/3 large subunit
MTQRLTSADAVVGSLIAHGVDTVFAIPGVQTYHLFDAFHRNAEHIRVIGPRHEQTTAYMAFGYAKSTGREGVYSVVPGPGILNAGAALCSAYGASTPILCLTGQVPSEFIGSGKGHLHELPDQLATLRTLTKWAARIEHPTQAADLTAEAFKQMRTGRPRPVALEMPWEVFGQQAMLPAPAAPLSFAPLAPDPADIDRAVALLREAKHPMILVGSGAMAAGREVLALAERLQAPIVSFRGGRGVTSDEHPLTLTCAAGYQRWAHTDVVIGIGSRLELQWFRWPRPPQPMKVINIDVDPSQTARLRPDVAVVSDAALGARALDAALADAGVQRASRHDEFQALKDRTWAAVQKIQPQLDYLKAIRAALPRDGFFVEEICQAGFASYYGLPIYEPRTFVTCGHQGTLGFGFPTALGVKAGNPDKAVVAITGDGGFMFGMQDLATAAQYNLGVVTVLFDNGAYGNVLRDQKRVFAGRVIGAELRNPDFVKLAESFGVHGVRANTPADLQREIALAIDRNAPALIVVSVDPTTEVSPWEFLMPAPYSV